MLLLDKIKNSVVELKLIRTNSTQRTQKLSRRMLSLADESFALFYVSFLCVFYVELIRIIADSLKFYKSVYPIAVKLTIK